MDRRLVQKAGIAIRPFKTFFDSRQLDGYQRGVMSYTYKGIACNKSPIDLAIYLRLLADVRPRTLVEIGSKAGGSALLFADFGKMLDLSLEVVSIDLYRPAQSFAGVTFLEGDVRNLPAAFDAGGIAARPRPWLVVEDSAHTAQACIAALDFFAERLQPGEWLVMEDGVLDDLGLAAQYQGGPNAAITQFFAAHPGVFEIGYQYCDMFGTQATYNPNGYLMRTNVPFVRNA